MACMYRAAAIVSGLWLLFSPALVGAAGKPAAVDTARLNAADREAGNWMSHGRTYGEQRFSPLSKVNENNIDQLGLAWQFKYDLDRVVEATPRWRALHHRCLQHGL
jgi:quinohemoprotein ethanol dehydrogenase